MATTVSRRQQKHEKLPSMQRIKEFAYKNRQIGMELISSGNVSDFSYICDIYSEMGRYTTGNYRIYKWTFNFNPYSANQNCSGRQILRHLVQFSTKIRNDISRSLFLKKRQNFKLSSAAKYRWCFKARVNLLHAG